MTPIQLGYRLMRYLDHPLSQHVAWVLSLLPVARVLDVGGRGSSYTIGLSAEVVVCDMSCLSGVPRPFDLGLPLAIRHALMARRTNVCDYLIDGLTDTAPPPKSFDTVVAVEVLHHVEQDEAFLANVARVLKPGGTYVMTTPNGDFPPTSNTHGKRQYGTIALQVLLERHFDAVFVTPRVNDGRLLSWGVPSSASKVRRALGASARALSYALEEMGINGRGKRHLVAVAMAPSLRPLVT
jgi:SAM-dependent methyltransferase